jgi:diguanylate cyclase (GGDEF)-like protein
MKELYRTRVVDRGSSDDRFPSNRTTSDFAVLTERLRSTIVHPLHRSIRVRIQLALIAALVGIVLMGAIVTASSILLLDTFERNVAEATEEIGPSHHLEIMLREAERLASLHAIQGNASTLSKFRQLSNEVDSQFGLLAEYIGQHAPAEHAEDGESIERARATWQEARDEILRALQSAESTSGAADSLIEAGASIASAYRAISDFHHHAMAEMREHLIAGQDLVRAIYYVTFGFVVIGFGLLIVIARFLIGSILHPIVQLVEAADRLRDKDLSHRVSLLNSQDELGKLGNAFNAAAASLQRLYRELERRSTHDGLTGVLNRAAFDERLATACDDADRRGRPVSLLMVDIDFFKHINDAHGHQTGDDVLRNVARILDEVTRRGDMVARYGGEEFAVILRECDDGSALAMAERLRKVIAASAFDEPAVADLNITASVGCATRLPHASTPKAFVKAADEALYQAKEAGRNRVCVGRLAIPEAERQSRVAVI